MLVAGPFSRSTVDGLGLALCVSMSVARLDGWWLDLLCVSAPVDGLGYCRVNWLASTWDYGMLINTTRLGLLPVRELG